MATLQLTDDKTIKLKNGVHCYKNLQKLQLFDCKVINIKLKAHVKIIILSDHKGSETEYINKSDKKVEQTVSIKLGRHPKIIVSCVNEVDIFPLPEISKVRNCNKCFNLKTKFTAQDINFIYQGDPFDLTLTIRVENGIVFIGIPALNFTLPVDGSLVTSSGEIPKKLRPQQAIPQSYTLETIGYGQNFNLYVKNDGSLSIYAIGPNLIPAGTYNTNSKTISYILPCFKIKPPKNYPLSEGLSQGPYDNTNAFLDFYNSDFVGDTIAFSWADNHDLVVPTDPQQINLNLVTRVGKIIRSFN